MTAATTSEWLRLDSDGIGAATAGLGDQLATALAAYSDVPGLPAPDQLDSVVVLGMGGSGVAGEVLAAVAHGRGTHPVVAVSDYRLPAFVGARTLVVAISFSGNTEETLSATTTALTTPAHVVAITGGGRLAELVGAAERPVIPLPAGIPQPRAAMAAMVVPLLLLCEQARIIGPVRADLDEAAASLSVRCAELAAGHGVAAEIARRIGRTIPLVHGAAGLGAVAARRFKTQVNENSKTPAFFAAEPEACHNEICGFGQYGDVTRQILTLIVLRTGLEHPRVARRFDLFAELAGEALAGVVDVQAEGASELARFFDLVAIGDFTSLHLAARDGIDPGPVPVLDEVKTRLAAVAG